MEPDNYTRREFLRTVGIGTAALAAAPQIILADNSSAKSPNVVLVITDDQGYGDLACHGNPFLETPNIDKLYSQSIRLTDFHVSPTCAPTRAALMTGRYCNRTGVWHTIMGRSLLRRDEVTMADVFAANGYRTGIFGKWHLGDNFPFRPQERGFHDVLIQLGGGIAEGPDYWGNNYFDDTYYRNGKPEKFKGYGTDIWFNEAMKFIEANRDRPFFCYLPTNAPHSPLNVAEKYTRLYKAKGVKSPCAEFYGMIANIDENMGRLMRKLDKLGLADNTILIFMTDNGTELYWEQQKFNAGMRGGKGSEYEGGHRVPCFIRWPGGKLTGGRDVNRLTAHIDLLPTLIELCGPSKSADIDFDGDNLMPLLCGDDIDWPDRTIVVDSQRVDHPIKWRKCAAMTDRWRLINGKELYDIKKDPGQKNDIAEEHADVVRRLRTEYEKWWTDTSERFDEYCRIIIGSDKENPACLTSHDTHGQVAWGHFQVQDNARTDGFWAVEIARDGTYEFELRRWPRELDKPISLGRGVIEDDSDSAQITATNARLKVACFDVTRPVAEGARAVTFRLPLKAGQTRLQAWFINGVEEGLTNGAYYVYVKRLS